MIPELELLEPHYEREDFLAIEKLRGQINAISDEATRVDLGFRWLKAMWPTELEFLSKTCWIITKEPALRLLKPNYAQRRFYEDVILRCREEDRPIRGCILKARQLGFSTFIQAWQFVQAVEFENRFAMTISYDDDSTEELFGKTKLMSDKMWFSRPLDRSRAKSIQFSQPHGSTFYAVTAGNERVGRGRTLHHLHCSELPFWPDAATACAGVQQSLPKHPITSNFYESTAQGAQGYFYDEWNKAEAGENDFVPFFAPWFWDPEYIVPFPSKDHSRKFMQSLNRQELDYAKRYKLSAEQMAWRAWKIANDLEGSIAKFQQEYPACAEEAFLSTGSPVFDPHAIIELRDKVKPALWTGDIALEHETHLAAKPGGPPADLD